MRGLGLRIDVSLSPTRATMPPANTSLPVISGTPTQGQTLSTTNGTWSNSPTSFTYQWKRNGAAIPGATAQTYLLVAADVGTIITVTVTASNAGGATSATSAGTAAIASSAPNLVSNGTFDTTTTGWTLGGGTGTIAVVAAKGRVTAGGASVQFSQSIATTIGATYNTLADVTNTLDTLAFYAVRKADNAGASINVLQLTSGDGVAQASSFVATATTTFIVLQVNSDTNRSDFDNIEVRAA